MNSKENNKVTTRVVTPNITISVELEQSPIGAMPSSLPAKQQSYSLATMEPNMG